MEARTGFERGIMDGRTGMRVSGSSSIAFSSPSPGCVSDCRCVAPCCRSGAVVMDVPAVPDVGNEDDRLVSRSTISTSSAPFMLALPPRPSQVISPVVFELVFRKAAGRLLFETCAPDHASRLSTKVRKPPFQRISSSINFLRLTRRSTSLRSAAPGDSGLGNPSPLVLDGDRTALETAQLPSVSEQEVSGSRSLHSLISNVLPGDSGCGGDEEAWLGDEEGS